MGFFFLFMQSKSQNQSVDGRAVRTGVVYYGWYSQLLQLPSGGQLLPREPPTDATSPQHMDLIQVSYTQLLPLYSGGVLLTREPPTHATSPQYMDLVQVSYTQLHLPSCGQLLSRQPPTHAKSP